MEQPHLKMIYRGLLLVNIDIQAKVKASFAVSVLGPLHSQLVTKLTADSWLDLMTEAVACRCATQRPFITRLRHAACCCAGGSAGRSNGKPSQLPELHSAPTMQAQQDSTVFSAALLQRMHCLVNY
jgi:hypothetical protein